MNVSLEFGGDALYSPVNEYGFRYCFVSEEEGAFMNFGSEKETAANAGKIFKSGNGSFLPNSLESFNELCVASSSTTSIVEYNLESKPEFDPHLCIGCNSYSLSSCISVCLLCSSISLPAMFPLKKSPKIFLSCIPEPSTSHGK